jgi:transcription elongation factor GreA
MTTTPTPPDAVHLTAEGRERLERQLGEYIAQRARLARRGDEEPSDVQDTGDEATRIQERDEQSQLEDRIAELRKVLERAQPIPPAAGDAAGLGSIVRVRTASGETDTYRLVDRAEVGTRPDDVAADSPVGRALLGHAAGDTVSVRTPDGAEQLTLVSVTPYRAAAG